MAKTSRSKAPKKKPTSKKAAASTQDPKALLAKVRRELAGLGVTNGKGNLFKSALKQMDALTSEIAVAADRVMAAAEGIQEAADAIGAKTKDRGIKNRLKKITANTGNLFETCSFQDITGQRIGKITRTVAAIETGVHSAARLAGSRGAKAGKTHAIDRIDGGIALEGPQVDGPAVAQADLDKLFD